MDLVPGWLVDTIVAWSVVYVWLSLLILVAIAMYFAFRWADERLRPPRVDFVETRMHTAANPRFRQSDKDGMWYCIGYQDGERIVGRGKTQERARVSYERRLDKFVAEMADNLPDDQTV